MVAPEERLARVEGILEEIRTRMNHLESRFLGLEERMEARFARLEQRFERLEERMDRRLGQLLWVSVTMWATLMGVVLTLGLVR